MRQAPQKEGGKILCDSDWSIHKHDVQNKWDDNTHTHTHIHPNEKTKERKALPGRSGAGPFFRIRGAFLMSLGWY